jgi:transcriptional regulator
LPKNSTHTIIERRSKVIMLLAEGKTQIQIAPFLKVSPQLIHDDKKAIERDAQKYIMENASKNTAYPLYISMDNILRVNREAWKIYEDKKRR